jgi:Tfp pilus assembly protein PilN
VHRCTSCPGTCLQEANATQSARLDDAAALLEDKDKLEETVKKQHALIEQRGQEVKVMKAQLDGKEAALEKARCTDVLLTAVQLSCRAIPK